MVSVLLSHDICGIFFLESSWSIFIEKSQTDIHRDGDFSVISRTGSKLIPVMNLDKLFSYANINIQYSELNLFRMSLSYTRMRELFISTLSSFVILAYKG